MMPAPTTVPNDKLNTVCMWFEAIDRMEYVTGLVQLRV